MKGEKVERICIGATSGLDIEEIVQSVPNRKTSVDCEGLYVIRIYVKEKGLERIQETLNILSRILTSENEQFKEIIE